VPLLLVPIPDISTIEPHRDRSPEVRRRTRVSRATVSNDFRVFSSLFLTALGHGARVVLNRGGVQGLVQGQKVLEDAGRHAIGDQRGPLRFHEEQFWSSRLSEEYTQRPECGRLSRPTPAVIEARTGEDHGAKEGAYGARRLFLHP